MEINEQMRKLLDAFYIMPLLNLQIREALQTALLWEAL